MTNNVIPFIRKERAVLAVQNQNQVKLIDLDRLKDPFTEQEIEFRISQCGETAKGQIWAKCLAYITGRAIMDRLDSVCGPENWKVSYDFVGAGGVICNLSIFLNGQWVTKQDGAEQTEIEAFKGGISSALKRAGSAWGMGRYLYSLDAGFVPSENILDSSREGAYFGKTKAGRNFYWIPPKLPAWALPKEDAIKGNAIQSDPLIAPIESPDRIALNRILMNLYRPYLTKFPETKFDELLHHRYNVTETRLMTVQQINDLVKFMKEDIEKGIRALKGEEQPHWMSE